MEERTDIGMEDHPIPFWIKLMWGIFITWGLIYLAIYWLPDLAHWMRSVDPDTSQWRDYSK